MGRLVRLAAGTTIASLTLRPQVPMGAIQSTGYICAMGAVDALRSLGISYAAIGWPSTVTDARTHRALLELRLKAGYDGTMFVACEVVGGGQVGLLRRCADELPDALASAIEARIDAWSSALDGRRGVAPLAPVLSEYVDMVALMGETVEVVYPNGRTMAKGRFAGVDVWGRATLVVDGGQEIELAAEQASLRAV